MGLLNAEVDLDPELCRCDDAEKGMMSNVDCKASSMPC
jgi:hypothetical protein